MKRVFAILIVFMAAESFAQTESVVGLGWAGNTINTVVFRRNSVVSDRNWQYVAYYDSTGHVVLARRNSSGGPWEVKQTPYKGNINDAHNSISIMLDGNGYLHMSCDHHTTMLRYSRSVSAGSLEVTDRLR